MREIMRENPRGTGRNMVWTLKTNLALVLIVLLLVNGCGGGGGSSGDGDSTGVIANAGEDQTIFEQTFVTLDGTGSTGNISSYIWDQIGGPPVVLNDADTAVANYMAPTLTLQTELRFRLTVSDNNGTSSSDTITNSIIPVNASPTADAGPDQFAPGENVVTLNGSQSSDSDGNIVSYKWSQIDGPFVPLDNDDTVIASFTAPSATDSLTFELQVTDNEGETDIDNVTVSVAKMLFSDDFSDGDQNNWTTNVFDDSNNPSAWQVNGGGYLLQQNDVEGIRNGGNPFLESYHLGTYAYLDYSKINNKTSYRFSVDITPLPNYDSNDGNDIGVMFRYQNNNNYYRFTINARYGFSRLEKKVAGDFSTLAVDSAGYYEEESLRITVELKGTLILIYVNDEPLFGLTDSDISSGSIALYCQDKVRFDNVLVTENSPAPSIVVSTPLAYSIATTDSDILNVSALATNEPSGSWVEFVLDNGQSIPDLIAPPYTAQFINLSQGEHTVSAILHDVSGVELARDTNDRIGIQGDYYVTVGDSITNGAYDNYSSDNISEDGRIIAIQGYQANLSDLLTSTLLYPHIVYNEGIGGDTSEEAATKRIDSILSRHPEVNKALILLGSVDSVGGVTDTEFQSNMQDLVDSINGTNPERQVWIALTPPRFELNGTPDISSNQDIQAYNGVIPQLNNIQLGPDFYQYFLGAGENRSSLFKDRVHPNALGHLIIAHLWHNKLNPFYPLPLPAILENLQPLNYKQNLLEIGDEYYTDEPYTLTAIPEELNDSIWVMTANNDRDNVDDNFLSFMLDFSATVYVAYDINASTFPTWLLSFNDTGLQVKTTDPSTPILGLYRDIVTGGPAPIILGGNHAGGGSGSSNYLVIVDPS